MEQPTSQEQEIIINVIGNNVEHVSLVWLLTDFLQHTGFNVSINSSTLYNQSEQDLYSILESIPSKLENLIENQELKIVINEIEGK